MEASAAVKTKASHVVNHAPSAKEDMTTSPSSSEDSGTEDSVSDCKSDQSLSTGYFPTENTFSYGETASYGEMASYGETASFEETASGNPSLHLLPPNQGSWGTGSVRRLFRKQDQMKEDREQFCKLSISLAWDTNVSSDQADTLANLDLNGQWQWMDRWPKDRTKLTPCKLDNLVQKLETFLEKEKGSQHDSPLHPESTQKEDVHLTSVPPPQTAWVRHEKHGICQDLPKHKTPKNKKSCQAPENPPRLREDEVMQEIGQAAKSSLETSSVVPIHHGEDSSHSYGTSCLNLRWVFHWLRTQVFSRLRREHSSQDTTSWHQKAARKIHSLRGNRIQPQE